MDVSQAMKVADQYWDTPEEGLRVLRGMAVSATGKALFEIQDAATMLARRSSSILPVETITSQARQ